MDTCLYQFAVSHYCEKVRWALDFKDVSYRVRNLLPGRHINTMRNLAPETSVPVLLMAGKVIQGSDRIIDYLDQQVTNKPLIPQDPMLLAQVTQWERFAADKIADPLRCFFYHYLLDDPKTLIQLFSKGGPWYGPIWLRLAYRTLNQRLRAVYQINPRTAQVAMHVVDKAIKQLEVQLATRPFLVGDSFSRADLSVAALLSPLVMPERGYVKPGTLQSTPLLDYRKAHINSPVFRWVNNLYNNYR